MASRSSPKRSAEYSVVVCRWECPICGSVTERLVRTDGPWRERAADRLRTHVRESDGHGHGRAGRLPVGFRDARPEEQVTVEE
ncbi:MAG: hypothetical protein ABEJ28_06540 [Salinigranum sp.]